MVIARYFRHNHEARDRRLNDARKIRDHTEQNERSERCGGKEDREVRAKAGADRKGRRKDAAGDAAYSGYRGGKKL